ncbi:hypothetical protein PICMEDRAFT_17535 [Pichia membranifaciens NRRL Y-2026]|uniref:Uncharacterized protein n=1 Tax=Pichia membranifaciens NRRL Y-2026 TaxID=763406 RepID=A0A1E3NFW7_9ASCO|nr:hypothetical protein PICMEDRAFT_17535 [Pichia membranifaciens NRRL Y-2026]ODQ45030.1 hypothetical protein PICMEDRAFT_17535 [Pichia membranifaciens NRRL Y-2026]
MTKSIIGSELVAFSHQRLFNGLAFLKLKSLIKVMTKFKKGFYNRIVHQRENVPIVSADDL